MARARSDFALACIDKPSGTFWEDLCFHAQQAAEKSVKAVRLNDYAVRARYPDDAEPVTADEYREAVKLAGLVLAWADGLLK